MSFSEGITWSPKPFHARVTLIWRVADLTSRSPKNSLQWKFRTVQEAPLATPSFPPPAPPPPRAAALLASASPASSRHLSRSSCLSTRNDSSSRRGGGAAACCPLEDAPRR